MGRGRDRVGQPAACSGALPSQKSCQKMRAAGCRAGGERGHVDRGRDRGSAHKRGVGVGGGGLQVALSCVCGPSTENISPIFVRLRVSKFSG